MNIEFEITRNCNMNCIGCDRLCNIIKDNMSDVSLDETKHILNEINNIKIKIDKFTVIGGEPTLNKECYEICKYVHNNLNLCKVFMLATNHTNETLANEIQNLGFIIRYDDNSNNTIDIAKQKFNKHLNILVSPKEENYKIINLQQCWILNTCGISIHKYNGQIKYGWCGAGTSICKLLLKTSFMKNSLLELLNSDISSYFNEICPNCIYSSLIKEYIKDNKNKISKCFMTGLNQLKQKKYI